MASPYQLVKKYEKEVMVILTGVAMFCFVIMDPLTGNSPTGGGRNVFVLPAVLAAVGAGVAWIHGTVTKKPGTYWVNGAIIGGCAGAAFILFASRSDAGVSTNVGKVTFNEIVRMKSQRTKANQFIQQAVIAREIPEGQFQDLMFSSFYRQFSFGGASNREMMLRHLLLKEADRLSIYVNDEAVIDYINTVSDKKLDQKKFRTIRGRLDISEAELFGILREELRVRITANILEPNAVYLPEQYWQDFQKFNVRQSISATAIPVELFAKQLEAPQEAQLKAFFEEHKSKFPGGDQPGFRLPDRKRLAYLSANVEALEKEVGEPKDEELQKLYDDRKEFYYKETELPDSSKKPDDAAKSEDSKTTPELKLPPPEKATEKKDDAQPEKKADEKKSEDAKPEPEKKADDKKPEEKKPEEKKPEEKKPEEKKPEEKKPEEKPADGDKKPADDAGCEGDEPAKQPEAKSEAKPETKPEVKPAAPSLPEDKDSKPEQLATEKPAAEKPAAEKPAEKPEGTTESKTEKTEAPAKYKSFESVKDDLKDVWLRDKTQALAKGRLEAAIERINQSRFSWENDAKLSNEERKPASFAKKLAAEIREYGKKLGLELGETKLQTAVEFTEDSDNPLATAREPFNLEALRNSRSMPQQASVAERAFGGTASLFVPEMAESGNGETQYVFWVFESIDEHDPTFDEEGVAAAVEKAWRLKEARPKAEKRATDLAEAITKKTADSKDTTFTAALGEETVTGDKNSVQLSVLSPSAFTWLRQSNPSFQMNMFGQTRVEFGSIPGIDNISNDFMQSIAEMSVGECKALANVNKDVFYVVQVTGRTPAGPEDAAFETARKQFLDNHLTMTRSYDQLSVSQFNATSQRWFEDFMRRFAVDLAALDSFGNE